MSRDSTRRGKKQGKRKKRVTLEEREEKKEKKERGESGDSLDCLKERVYVRRRRNTTHPMLRGAYRVYSSA